MFRLCLGPYFDQDFQKIEEELSPINLFIFKELCCIAVNRIKYNLRFRNLVYRKKIFLMKQAQDIQNLFEFECMMMPIFSNLRKTSSLLIYNYYMDQFENP